MKIKTNKNKIKIKPILVSQKNDKIVEGIFIKEK